MKGYLILENGTIFQGTIFGKGAPVSGEVVFTTGMTGYQEILTDPSFCGQIVTFTYPLIGNYGINPDDFEANNPSLAGIIVSELCTKPSNWRNKVGLADYLRFTNIPGIEGIDTRMLTKALREKGTMGGRITTNEQELAELKADPAVLQVKLTNQVACVTTVKPRFIPGGAETIVLVDFGAKKSIMENLLQLGYSVLVVPAFTGWQEILAYEPAGVLLSNGPGNPKDIMPVTETIKKLLGQVPVMGVCLGHQLLGLALGMDTYKLPFGHRGANHPVKDLVSGQVMITSQNHGYVLNKSGLPAGVEVSHLSLNDETVEGIKHKSLSAFSVQFHPEAFPGPADAKYLYGLFQEMIEEFKN